MSGSNHGTNRPLERGSLFGGNGELLATRTYSTSQAGGRTGFDPSTRLCDVVSAAFASTAFGVGPVGVIQIQLTGYGAAARAQITRIVGDRTTVLNFSYSRAPGANTIVLTQDGFGALFQGGQLSLQLNLNPTTGIIAGGEISRREAILYRSPTTPGARQTFTCN